jgi:hypothetical protein
MARSGALLTPVDLEANSADHEGPRMSSRLLIYYSPFPTTASTTHTSAISRSFNPMNSLLARPLHVSQLIARVCDRKSPLEQTHTVALSDSIKMRSIHRG